MKRIVAVVLIVAALASWWWLFSTAVTSTVVVYVSPDQVFSEPILKDFEKDTGITVRAVL